MHDHTTTTLHNNQGRLPLSAILAAHGAGFVKVRPPGQQYKDWRTGEPKIAKGKEPVGIGWQKNPCTLADAAKWVKLAGGNVGLAGGHNNLILLDADAGADQVEAAEPRLRDTVRIFRSNAPDRAKWIVRIDGELPPSKKKHGVLEVLASGTQGVIVGWHESGARIEYEGRQIVTLTADDIRRLWRTLTGDELGHAARKEAAAPPDTEAVKRGVALAEAVLAAGDIPHTAWQPYEGGLKAIMTRCPFNPPDNPHAADEAAVIIVGPDGRIGATCHHARCQERIHQHGGSGWALLKELVGYQPPVSADHVHARHVVDYLREWVRRTDLAEHVPPIKQAANGYRTRDTDTAVADAILDIADMHGRLRGLPLSQRDLRKRTNLGSSNTAGKALDRLSGWFVVEEPSADRQAHEARRYAIHPALIAWAEEQIEVAYIARGISETYDQDNTRAMYATSPLVTHRTRDAFTSPQRPITEEELQARIDERKARIAAGEDLRPLDRRRYRRRLAALLPAMGRTVLRMIDALDTEGGKADRHTLRTLLNLTASSLSRAVSRAAELGLVSADRRTVTLHEGWRELVDAFEPYMPTAGRAIDREISDLDATIRNAERLLAQPDADHRRLERRIGRCRKRKQELAAMMRPDLEHRHADRAAPSAFEMAMLRRLAERHEKARLDMAAERHAENWRLIAEVKRLRREGVQKRDAWRMLEMGGWQRGEVAGVMAVVWPAKAAHA